MSDLRGPPSPRDLRGPPSPQPQPEPDPDDSSIAETIRGVMHGVGELGLALGSDGSYHGDTYGNSSSSEDGRPAKSWWGRILQWAWALLVFLFGLAVLAFFLLVGIGWVMSWFA